MQGHFVKRMVWCEVFMLKFQLCALFLLGYLAIVFEHVVRLNKSAVALTMGGLMWLVYFFHLAPGEHMVAVEEISDMAQVVFFLFAAMAIVELIDAHKGFSVIVRCCQIRSTKLLLWALLIISFFLSACLDNLTSIIIIVSVLKHLVKTREHRLILGALCVIAVNAGGAWTPLGDVTTTMLWINNKVTTWEIIYSLFVPSVVCAAIAGLLGQTLLSQKDEIIHASETCVEKPLAKSYWIVGIGIGSLFMVPVWKSVLGVPPFVGALLGLGLVWIVSDWVHFPHGEDRQHLRVPYILTKIDISSITFFIGILLSINILYFAGILSDLASWMDTLFSRNLVAVFIGFISSVLDNVPLVAATMNMYDVPTNDSLWKLIAYAAGTGGSLLIIGSAAGVAFMGLEKVSFIWYLKRISWIALTSYVGGLVTYFLLEKAHIIF